ncbi:MAG: YbaB/EbfC family nucleoid-associated protein [Acidaminococcales bacterium]|jgi:DNA-binding YbaB/EbfC family protein|nr:YbaB/EbfC family nucleoid-associated protein [Acidaminococcales bacterium]
MFGNMGNMQGMVKKMQKLQTDMAKMQEEIKAREFETAVGGGAVSITVNGGKELIRVKIAPSVLNEDDAEMLEDMIIAAVNETHRKIDETLEREIGKITGGVKLPGLF